MTKEEIEQAAEDYLMNNNHNEDTAIRDGFKAGFYFASRNDQSEFIKLQSENERLKSERDNIREIFMNHLIDTVFKNDSPELAKGFANQFIQLQILKSTLELKVKSLEEDEKARH